MSDMVRKNRNRKAIGGVPRGFKPSKMTIEEAIEGARTEGRYDAARLLDGLSTEEKFYSSAKAYRKVYPITAPDGDLTLVLKAYHMGLEDYLVEFLRNYDGEITPEMAAWYSEDSNVREAVEAEIARRARGE